MNNKNFKQVNTTGKMVVADVPPLLYRSGWGILDVDNIDFEEIIEYVQYARRCPWVLNRENRQALRNDIIFSMISDYFEKRLIDIHPSQTVKISKIIMGNELIEVISDDEAYRIWNIVKPKEPPF